MSPLEEFALSLKRPDLVDWLRGGLIGDSATISGPFGSKPLIYADYVASGRALAQVEDFIRDRVLPYYANSHTQASYCGAFSTRLREAARAEIARITGADSDCSVVFAGSGATAGINRIVGLLDIAGTVARGGRAVVLVGPYEHHSNLLPWRESGAEVIEIAEGSAGGPDPEHLRAALAGAQGAELIVGSFSAASNVTGIVTDTDSVTATLREHGALAVWDYAGGAPYIPMSMGQGAARKDAIVFSPHKFPGGPGASGVMVVRDSLVRRATPTLPGGGTVSFVSPWGHAYSGDVAHREEGGTPNVLGDIRAGLVLMVKEALGQDWLSQRQDCLRARALEVWRRNPQIEILGPDLPGALPVFSFRVRDGQGGTVHHQFFTRLLSDLYGIQARGGCACAGSYAHRLLGLDETRSAALFAALEAGEEMEKPGWVRLNLSALMSDDKVAGIISAVDNLARSASDYLPYYDADETTARFAPADRPPQDRAQRKGVPV